MKKVNNLQEALDLFIKYGNTYPQAVWEGKSKLINRISDKLLEIAIYLKQTDNIEKLYGFLYHSSLGVQINAAYFMLLYHEKEALKILKKIAKTNNIISLEAEMLVKEWKKGNIKPYLKKIMGED